MIGFQGRAAGRLGTETRESHGEHFGDHHNSTPFPSLLQEASTSPRVYCLYAFLVMDADTDQRKPPQHEKCDAALTTGTGTHSVAASFHDHRMSQDMISRPYPFQGIPCWPQDHELLKQRSPPLRATAFEPTSSQCSQGTSRTT